MQEELTQTKNEASVLPPVYGTSEINVGTGERILSVAGGAALAVIGLTNFGKVKSFPLLLAGGYMILRGATGYCQVNTMIERNTATRKSGAAEASGTYIINKPRQEVYAYWRRLENLPIFMKHLQEVRQMDERRSKWKAKIPGGFSTISSEADILEDQPGELLTWISLPGSTIDNAGMVSFLDAPGGGTEVTAKFHTACLAVTSDTWPRASSIHISKILSTTIWPGSRHALRVFSQVLQYLREKSRAKRSRSKDGLKEPSFFYSLHRQIPN